MPRRASSQTIDGVAVVGGGYAGLHAARAAHDRGAEVTVIDATGRHDFVTRLAAVAGRTASRRDASTPIEEFGHTVIVGELAGLDDGIARLSDGRTIVAEALVIATGSVPASPEIEGLEHARPLRTADDALALREALDTAEAVTIIGGGATGVQLAGAIGASEIVTTVRIVDMADRLLSSMATDSSDGAERILRDRGVEILTNADVASIDEDGVVVDGEHQPGLVVWAGGFTAGTDGWEVPLDTSGRVAVDEFLRVDGWEHTFAAGDIAAHVDADGNPMPMSAQVAVQAGEAAGRNAARLVSGRPLRAAELSHQGWVLDLSGHRGIAELGGVTLAAPFADLIPPFLHDAIDLKTLFGIGGLGALLN